MGIFIAQYNYLFVCTLNSTHIHEQWVEFVYFVFALIIDLLPCGSAIKVAWFHKYRDWMFTTLVLPMALVRKSTIHNELNWHCLVNI